MIFGKRYSRKGSLMVESVVVIVVITVLSLLAIYGHSLFSELNSGIQNSEMAQEGKDSSNKLFLNYARLFDNLLMFAFGLLTLFTVISAFMFDNHPVFFVVSLVLLIVCLVGILEIGNSYDDIVSDSSLSFSANQFPYISWLMHNILKVGIGLGFIILIVMYIKFKGG